MPAAEDFDEARHVAASRAKIRGLAAYADGDYTLAARCFGEAIAVAVDGDPDAHIYRSNRCAARLQLGDITGATEDATQCTKLAPKWPKGWSRLGNCLSRQPGRGKEAERALKTAIKLGSKDAEDALNELRAKQSGYNNSNNASGSGSWSGRFWEGLVSFHARVGSLMPARLPTDWRDAVTLYQTLDEKIQWLLKALVCLLAFFIGRSVFGGPELPFGLGKSRTSRFSGLGRNKGSYSSYGEDERYDDSRDISSATLGGVGTVAALAVLYFAYKQGASPYTLMMLANMLGLTGGGRRRRGYGGYGMPGMGMGGMRGRRGLGGGFF
tara:strand:+ start:78 stop:1052 length:975 start_codon:yes stop_codon:yes gene_type:complete